MKNLCVSIVLVSLLLILVSCGSESDKETTGQTTISESSDSDADGQTTVYITKTGSKYHRGSCRYLRKSKIAISLEKARKRYDPCSACNPPTTVKSSNPTVKEDVFDRIEREQKNKITDW